MKDELKRFKNCPICDKDMGVNHITDAFVGMIEIFKSKIEFRRGQKSFQNWLLKKQDDFSEELEKNTLICNPENFYGINHDGLIYLSVLYNELDIIDNEIAILDGDKIKIPEKYYAWYTWMLIKLGKIPQFNRNEDDKFSQKEIKAFGKNRFKAWKNEKHGPQENAKSRA
jgi:hypothetical protein